MQAESLSTTAEAKKNYKQNLGLHFALVFVDFNYVCFALQIAGYLNLCANAIDNFTHGLSLGGAFLVSIRSGIFTTFAILMHEVPHEVGDFAILLKSGFSRWDAAKYQLYTASGGLIGSLVAILCSGASNSIGIKLVYKKI